MARPGLRLAPVALEDRLLQTTEKLRPRAQGSQDRALVEAFLDTREESAFAALYRRHTPQLMGLAVRLLGGVVAEAEDAVQETWSRAVPQLASFRWEAALSTWLSAILVRHCHERRRASARVAEPADIEIDVSYQDQSLIATADRVDLTRAIAGLPDGFRFVLVLHDIEGYTHEEIAALAGIHVGTSKRQLSRARAALRRRLAGSRHTS
jgi:RNA polymerase sigma-70 factor (ECF subfamily)